MGTQVNKVIPVDLNNRPFNVMADENGNYVTVTSNKLDVNVGSADSVVSGQKTVTTAGTAEALAVSTTILSVTIKALAGNTNNVYVGPSSVDSSNGYVLAAGEAISLDINNLADVYLDVDTNGEGASYIGVV